MKNDDHQKRYETLLKEGELTGKVYRAGAGEERRLHPRFRIEGTEMLIDVQLQVSVIDISRSGVCFFSNVQFQPGHRFSFKIGAVFSVTAEVVECKAEETDSSMMEVRYRVRCRFSEQELELPQLLKIIDR